MLGIELATLAMMLSADPPQQPLDNRDLIYYPSDTESPIPLGKKLVKNVLLDEKEIWLSPFHMHRKDAIWWIGIGAVTTALIATDKQSSKIFENSAGQITWGNHISNLGSTYTLIPVVAGLRVERWSTIPRLAKPACWVAKRCLTA